MATSTILELKIKWLQLVAAKDPTQEVRDAAVQGRTLLQNYKNAITANQQNAADDIAQQITDLVEHVKQLRQQTAGDSWPKVGMGGLAVVFIAVIALLIYYVSKIGVTGLITVEGIRPLLVITAIVSTIAFGGSLLLGSLFSSDGSIEERFRRAREVFLVFSGIFGTVVGFYFGAGESKGSYVGVDAFLEDATLVAYATGGAPPYSVTVSYGPKGQTKTEETKTGLVRFVFDKKTDNIIPLKLSVTDSRGAYGALVRDFAKDELAQQGWLASGGSPPEPAKKGAAGNQGGGGKPAPTTKESSAAKKPTVSGK